MSQKVTVTKTINTAVMTHQCWIINENENETERKRNWKFYLNVGYNI